jgi:hypothetical protein
LEQNPADIATRATDEETLKNNKLWWNGPGGANLKGALEMNSHKKCLKTNAKEKGQ